MWRGCEYAIYNTIGEVCEGWNPETNDPRPDYQVDYCVRPGGHDKRSVKNLDDSSQDYIGDGHVLSTMYYGDALRAVDGIEVKGPDVTTADDQGNVVYTGRSFPNFDLLVVNEELNKRIVEVLGENPGDIEYAVGLVLTFLPEFEHSTMGRVRDITTVIAESVAKMVQHR